MQEPVRTLQGVPGPPSNLTFSEITMSSLKISWNRPLSPNGEILGYIVEYETAKQDESKYRRFKFYDRNLNGPILFQTIPNK